MLNIKALLGLVYYTSKLDEFLAEYDKNHPALSHSQRKERKKYACIDSLRDKPSDLTAKKSLLNEF